MDNRADLIQSLAGAMGMSGKARRQDSHFDPSTGTLYCGSKVYSASDVAAAREFCQGNAEKMASLNDSSSAFYEIAVAAIETLEKDSVSSGGRVIVPNSSN